MGVIRVLPDQVANKIAAGEVVERPASVVKELVENALDAQATYIRLEVEAGGRKRIRVIDNGCGMVRDDALLAFERHATSKLRDSDDLLAISTLGFRGEALPSIGAVSRLTLETCAQGQSGGTRVEVTAGKIRNVSDVGLPGGTAITVEDLFLNIPARRKFLKTDATELGHITTLVTHYALAYPEIHFELTSANRMILSAPAVSGYAERMQQIFGPEMLASLIDVTDQVQWPRYAGEEEESPEPGQAPSDPGMSIFGFVSRPELQKLNRNSIFTFVNRRLVRDRLVQHAISEAYRNMLPSNTFPVVLLFLDLPYTEVDVNVHPAKVEVRFRRQGFIHDAVRDAVRRALSASRPIPSFVREMTARPTATPELTPGAAAAFGRAPWSVAQPEVSAIDEALGLSASDADFRLTPELLPPEAQRLPFTGAATTVPAAETEAARTLVPESRSGCGAVIEAPVTNQPADLTDLRALGQIRESFIVAANASGLWIIDQHVAHERVLFEQVLEERMAGTVEQQHLLMPLIVELDPGRWVRFAEIADELRKSGFQAEPFGSRTVAVTATPAGIPADRVQRLLDELLEVPEQELRETSLDRLRTRIAATIACHAAIKVNMPLDMQKMNWLLGALAQTRFPMTCPHGRPVLLRYTLADIQRAFKRI